MLLPNRPIVTGKDAIRAGLKEAFADPAFTFDGQTVKVEVSKSGDIAYSQGTYTSTVTDPKTKQVMSEKGKYIEIYRKQADGSWKDVEDTAIPDAPPEPVKPAK